MIRQVTCSICHVHTIGFTGLYHTGLANHPFICDHCICKAKAQLERWGFGNGHVFYDWLVDGTRWKSDRSSSILNLELDKAYADVLRSVLAAKRKVS